MAEDFVIENGYLVEYKGKDKNVVIPDGVVGIMPYVFSENEYVESVSIPDSVVEIYNEAFEECPNLCSVNLPKNLSVIRIAAFAGCKNLQEITLPKNLKKIFTHAFAGCKNLSKVNIESDSLFIDDDAFIGCDNIKSVKIPSGTIVCPDSFEKGIELDIEDGVSFVIEEGKLISVLGNAKDIEIPEDVLIIGSNAFRDNRFINSVVIPSYVFSIEEDAFKNCPNLTNVNFFDGLVSVGDGAFKDCPKLEKVLLPDTLKNLNDKSVFDDNTEVCRLVSLEDPVYDELFSRIQDDFVIENGVFIKYTGNDKNVVIPDCVGKIKSEAFIDSNVDSVTVPNSVKVIEGNAFYRVKNVNIYNGLEVSKMLWGALTVNGTIEGDFIYADKDKTHLTAYIGKGGDVTIPHTVTSIGKCAFIDCDGLNSIDIPNSVTNIDKGAFYRCSGLKSVKIPSSVENLGAAAFFGCSQLFSVDIPSTVKKICLGTFSQCRNLKNINLSADCVVEYSAFEPGVKITRNAMFKQEESFDQNRKLKNGI